MYNVHTIPYTLCGNARRIINPLETTVGLHRFPEQKNKLTSLYGAGEKQRIKVVDNHRLTIQKERRSLGEDGSHSQGVLRLYPDSCRENLVVLPFDEVPAGEKKGPCSIQTLTDTQPRTEGGARSPELVRERVQDPGAKKPLAVGFQC